MRAHEEQLHRTPDLGPELLHCTFHAHLRKNLPGVASVAVPFV